MGVTLRARVWIESIGYNEPLSRPLVTLRARVWIESFSRHLLFVN